MSDVWPGLGRRESQSKCAEECASFFSIPADLASGARHTGRVCGHNPQSHSCAVRAKLGLTRSLRPPARDAFAAIWADSSVEGWRAHSLRYMLGFHSAFSSTSQHFLLSMAGIRQMEAPHCEIQCILIVLRSLISSFRTSDHRTYPLAICAWLFLR